MRTSWNATGQCTLSYKSVCLERKWDSILQISRHILCVCVLVLGTNTKIGGNQSMHISTYVDIEYIMVHQLHKNCRHNLHAVQGQVPKVWLISDSGSSAKNSEMRPVNTCVFGAIGGREMDGMVRIGVIILQHFTKHPRLPINSHGWLGIFRMSFNFKSTEKNWVSDWDINHLAYTSRYSKGEQKIQQICSFSTVGWSGTDPCALKIL